MRDRTDDDEAFRSFVQLQGPQLLHLARLLTGDRHAGEDLNQNVMIKLYLKWDRVEQPLAYARKAMVSTHIDSARRRWWGERPTEELPETIAPGAPEDALALRDEIRHLLRGLSARERAVVVLRYYCDLSEADTAQMLNMPLGTVKSTCSRALNRLRVDAEVTR